jgi:RNA polymerase sigma-70 factor, ECF subfamily
MDHDITPSIGIRNAASLQDDRQLAWQAAHGDQEAFAKIMQRYNQQLYRLAVGMMGDRFEAEDILQEGYLRAFARIGDYSGQGTLGGWLASIIRHEAIDRLRLRNRRREHVSLEVDMRNKPGEDPPLARARADEACWNPETDVERAQMRRLLEREIEKLPDAFRVVFILREVEGLSVEETAAFLGIPDATVKSRDFRARALLKAKLGDQIDASLPQTFTFLNQECASLVARVMNRMKH